jgi:Fe(3+) dicitrate transport protein
MRASQHPLSRSLLCLAIATALIAPAIGAEVDEAGSVTRLDRTTVVGSVEKAHEAAGSAHYIGPTELDTFDYSDIHRVLRSVPGVYLIDEEGFGLRPNIGIRGSGTDRNNRITVMEDGVLIAPATYAAPAAYLFPTMARMSAVEIRKGSSAIKAGPRTTGGVINLLSTPIPLDASGKAELAYGSDSTFLGHAWAGGSGERSGWLVETVQQASDGFKRLDNGGDTGYRLEDHVFKFRLNSDPNARIHQQLDFKLVQTDQDSDETYLGLTDADFAQHANRRYAGSQLDNITTRQRQYEIRHQIELNPALDLTTVVYRHESSRAWYKLQDVTGTGLTAILRSPETHAQRLEWLRGATSPDDALRMRNNNRRYEAEGVQSVLGWQGETGRIEHALEVGLRWHRDHEDRFQQDDRYRMQAGQMLLTTPGLPGSQENRLGEAEALAFFVQNEMRFGNWLLTPGLRYETIDLTRTDWALRPDGRAAGPIRVMESSVDAWMPGLGITRLLSDDINVFVSMHRGFNPPGPGSTADPERSINTEFGFRYGAGALSGEIVGFWNDYSNLVGTCTVSTGGGCTIGDQFDGGAATVRGLEASVGYDLAHGRGWALSVPLQLAYTWTDARFDSSFSSSFGEWDTVRSGDRLPYLPQHTLHASAGLVGERWRLNLGVNFIDDMRTVASQGSVPAGERTDHAWVFDLAAAYRLTDTAEVFARVENLTDEVYIVSRRPSGARPGRSQAGFLGLRVNF